jgi:hypothetical protein
LSTGASHFVQKQESNNVSANKVQANDNTVSEKDKKKDKHNEHGEQFDSK